MAAEFRLGIQSYTFRGFKTLSELIDALKQAGLSYVEIWPVHIPFEASQEQQKQALDMLKAAGITIDSYGQVEFGNDEEKARQPLEFAKRAGIKAITSDVDPDAYELMERLCNEYDINLAVHNHGRGHRYGRVSELKELFSKTGPCFGLCLDTAWLLDAGEDPLEAIDLFRDRIYGVHLKDFVFDKEGNRSDVIIGTGGLRLPAFMEKLKDIEFQGYLSIEYEGDLNNPLPAMTQCVKAAMEVIDAL